jgi:hypothetical protein
MGRYYKHCELIAISTVGRPSSIILNLLPVGPNSSQGDAATDPAGILVLTLHNVDITDSRAYLSQSPEGRDQLSCWFALKSGS